MKGNGDICNSLVVGFGGIILGLYFWMSDKKGAGNAKEKRQFVREIVSSRLLQYYWLEESSCSLCFLDPNTA